MAIRTICPSCRTIYNLADHLDGKTVRCKNCEAAIVVRAANRNAEAGRSENESRRSAIAREKTQARPQRRIREQEEDEDFSPPIRRSNRGLVIGLIAGGAGLILLLAGVVLVVIFLLPNRSSPGNPAADLRADVGGFNRGRRPVPPLEDRVPDFPGNADELPNADMLTRALHHLKSPSLHVRHEALRKLKDTLPDERRAEVVKALEPMLNDPDIFTRKWAVEAIGVWANKDDVPILLKAMRDGDTRHEAMKALGRLKDERAIEPIAQRLEEHSDLHEAGEALKSMGPMAEKAVLARLNHHDWFVRIMVCEILERIGTAQSIPALEGAEVNDFSIKIQSRNAINAIKARQ